jgi:hypothetical protein
MSAKNPFRHSDDLYDVRIVPHVLRRGGLSREQLQAHLDQLPDDAAEAEEANVRFQPVRGQRR